MSYAAEKWARTQTVGNSRAKIVLIELANCLNDNSGKCCPSIAYISRVTEMKPDTIVAATKFLVQKGFITKTQITTKNGRGIQYELVGYSRKRDKGGIPENGDNPELGDIPENGKTGIPENGNRTYKRTYKLINKKENTKEKSFDENADDVPELFPETTYELTPAEVEEKPKTKRITKKSLIRPSDCSEQIFSDWVDFKRKVSKSVTQYMVNAIAREAQKAHITSEQAMVWQMEKGYQGFSADWYLNNSAVKQQKPSQQRRELTPEDFSDNQISFFASKLVRDQSFISEFGIGQTDYGIFASKVAANFRNPRFFPRYVTYLQKLGLIRH